MASPTLEYATPLHPFLRDGERVIWFDQPRQGWHLTPELWLIVTVACAWTIFNAARFVWGDVTLDSILRRPRPRDITAVAGLILAAVLVWRNARFRRNTWYGITSRRLILLWGEAGSYLEAHLTAYDLRELPPMELVNHRDGTGSISFLLSRAAEGEQDSWWRRRPWPAGRMMYRIREAAHVYRMLRELQIKASPGIEPPELPEVDPAAVSECLDEDERVYWAGKPRRRRDIVYALTSTRVIIASASANRRIVSYSLSWIPRVKKREHRDGLTSIYFVLRGPDSSPDDLQKQQTLPGHWYNLKRVANADGVYGVLRRVRDAQLTPTLATQPALKL